MLAYKFDTPAIATIALNHIFAEARKRDCTAIGETTRGKTYFFVKNRVGKEVGHFVLGQNNCTLTLQTMSLSDEGVASSKDKDLLKIDFIDAAHIFNGQKRAGIIISRSAY
jgi:hypothetical protein